MGLHPVSKSDLTLAGTHKISENCGSLGWPLNMKFWFSLAAKKTVLLLIRTSFTESLVLASLVWDIHLSPTVVRPRGYLAGNAVDSSRFSSPLGANDQYLAYFETIRNCWRSGRNLFQVNTVELILAAKETNGDLDGNETSVGKMWQELKSHLLYSQYRCFHRRRSRIEGEPTWRARSVRGALK